MLERNPAAVTDDSKVSCVCGHCGAITANEAFCSVDCAAASLKKKVDATVAEIEARFHERMREFERRQTDHVNHVNAVDRRTSRLERMIDTVLNLLGLRQEHVDPFFCNCIPSRASMLAPERRRVHERFDPVLTTIGVRRAPDPVLETIERPDLHTEAWAEGEVFADSASWTGRIAR